MKKQILIIVALLIIQFNGFAQKNINNYKYIIVPKSYGFLGDEDKFQLNSLTKFLFNKLVKDSFFNCDLYSKFISSLLFDIIWYRSLKIGINSFKKSFLFSKITLL